MLRAQAGLHVGELVGPLGVEDLVDEAVLLADDLAAEVVVGEILVHMALAVGVGLQKGVDAELARVTVAHGAAGPVLDLGARPQGDAVAVAHVGGRRC